MILILTDPAVGGTFLTWTLHYLSGHSEYFHSKSNTWRELINDPVTELNAHGFQPNQAISVQECYSMSENLKNTTTNNFHTLYLHNLMDQPEYNNKQLYHAPSVDAIKHLSNLSSKVVVLHNQHQMFSMSLSGRVLLHKLTNPSVRNQSFEEQHFDFIEYFFKDNHDHWIKLGLTNTWDHREFLALNIRPNAQLKIKPNVDNSIDHYLIDTFDFYNTFDQWVIKLFDYLNIAIDQTRIDHWTTIYHKWRKLHTKRMQFVWYFDTIIDSIVNNYDLDLTRFDLDIVQEACIQHSLIYKHNLNFKTWQLDKFINTKQLHQLLETNQHPLSEY